MKVVEPWDGTSGFYSLAQLAVKLKVKRRPRRTIERDCRQDQILTSLRHQQLRESGPLKFS